MPKLKTHKSTAKRFKLTGTGKLRRLKHRRSHLRRKKSKRALREMRQNKTVAASDLRRVERLLGTRVSRG